MQRELVERARTGDRDAFSDLARASMDRQYAVATLILRDSDRAQDAVQEALVSAWRDMRALRDPDAWDAWLHRLTVRACYRLARKERRRNLVELHVVPDPEPARPYDLAMSVAERDRMERELDRLPIDQRAVMVLHFYLDLPLTEAADDPGYPRRDRQVPAALRPAGPSPVDGGRARGVTGQGADGMTDQRTIERQTTALLSEVAPTRAPDRLYADVLTSIGRTRQRAALAGLPQGVPHAYPLWSRRRLADVPARLHRGADPGAHPGRGAAAVATGASLLPKPDRSPRRMVSPAMAPSRSTRTATSGSPTPSGNDPRLLIGGASDDTLPLYSRDGTRFVFERRVAGEPAGSWSPTRMAATPSPSPTSPARLVVGTGRRTTSNCSWSGRSMACRC